MPNDSLISALETQRETYSQRQKATTNLVAAMKGATGAITKASRTIKDYADQSPNNLNGIMNAQQTFGTLRLREEVVDPLMPDLRREVKALTSLTTSLKDAIAALRGESVDVVKLGHAYAALQATKIQDAGLTELLPEIDRELQQAQQELGATFGQALRHALAEQGIEIGGRPPRFEVGRFEIEANFVRRTASVSYGKDIVIKRVPLSVDAVLAAYQRANKMITGRNEDGNRWVEQFYNAWDIARRKRGTNDQRANIVDCYFEMVMLRQGKSFHSFPSKQSFVDYSRAQFAYDFFEFANQQRRDYRGQKIFGHGATKSQAESVDKSIWIVEGDNPHNGRYIADIVFSKDE